MVLDGVWRYVSLWKTNYLSLSISLSPCLVLFLSLFSLILSASLFPPFTPSPPQQNQRERLRAGLPAPGGGRPPQQEALHHQPRPALQPLQRPPLHGKGTLLRSTMSEMTQTVHTVGLVIFYIMTWPLPFLSRQMYNRGHVLRV